MQAWGSVPEVALTSPAFSASASGASLVYPYPKNINPKP